MAFGHLFSPINIRGCIFPNRIMSTAAVTRLAKEDGHITEEISSRYQRMAKGGLGAMVVEAAVVLPSRSSFNLRVSDDQFVDELKGFVEGIRTVNPEVKVGLQLIHFLKLSRSGWRVHVVDSSEKARETFLGRIGAALKKPEVDYIDSFRIHANLNQVPWDDVEICVECVSEELSLKQKVFSELERLSRPGIPLASNSSSFPISRIGNGLQTQSRMLGLHFFMPAHLVPLVEVICSEFTKDDVAERTSDIMKKLGKRPVQVKKDIPGFLANRIQHALMREAISLVEKGVASVEDVDIAVRYGFGFRFIVAGPLLQKDLSGLDINYNAAKEIYPDLCNEISPSGFLADKVARGHTGAKALKGFYDWTEEAADKEKARYEKMLQAALKILKEEEMGQL